MRMRTAVLDLELCRSWSDVIVPNGYARAHLLLRWRGRPVACVEIPVTDGRIPSCQVWQLAAAVVGPELRALVLCPDTDRQRPDPGGGSTLSSTVIICTRDRTDDLAQCLRSVCAGRLERTDVLVVDNAPSTDATAQLVKHFPVRYVREDRRGLNWARSLGIRTARTDLVLFCDDDTTVDTSWAEAMRAPFGVGSVGAVTGLVMPQELETDSQRVFERAGGFSRGFTPRNFNIANHSRGATGAIGAGASMAFRRQLALELRLFEIELDAGTHALSGGDTYALYRVLRHGHTIAYNPEALSWHRHRRTREELCAQLRANSVGIFCFALRCLECHRDVVPFVTVLKWFVRVQTLRGAGRLPAMFRREELRGALAAPSAYLKARLNERRLASNR